MKNGNLLLEFHSKTKTVIYNKHKSKKIPSSWIKIFFKNYPRFKQIKLPKPTKIRMNLDICVKKRESFREFSDKQITKQQLSNLLFYSAGIINLDKVKNWNETKRAYPSAGARYPLELYLAIFNVKNIEKGLYHYNVKAHSLELMIPRSVKKEIYSSIYGPMINASSIVIIITAVFNRTKVKYGDRAYRYILLDAGHLAQNIYLNSTAQSIGCCAIGGFTDDKINKLLDLILEEEGAIYLIALGSK